MKKDDPFIRKGKYVVLKYEDDFTNEQTKKLLVIKKNGLNVVLQTQNTDIEKMNYNFISLMKDDINIREAFELWNN